MTLVKHDGTKHEPSTRRGDLFDRFFEEWPSVFRRPVLLWPEHGLETMRVDQFMEDDTLVVRLEIAGIDPDKDVEISIDEGMLRIEAERREEETTKERGYVRKEMQYGSFYREFPLPAGTKSDDIKASYKDGILEVRVPTPKAEHHDAKKVSISKG